MSARLKGIYLAVVITSLVFMILDAWISSQLLQFEPLFDPVIVKDFVLALSTAIIWLPYMLLLRRAKATFVEKAPEKEERSQIL